MNNDEKKRWRQALVFLGAGTELAIMVAAGAVGGYYVDQYWKSSPWCAIIGVLAGTTCGFYNLYRILKKFQ